MRVWSITPLALLVGIGAAVIPPACADAGHAPAADLLTIDLLLMHSKFVTARLGESAARARLVEGLQRTNTALANSGSQFRYRSVGIREYPTPANWTTLDQPVRALRDSRLVQQWRNELKADGVYYEGAENGCGLAWVRSSSYNMVATGSIRCGTTVMRHELGHNMGLAHGRGPVRHVMAGNDLPFYGTPHRFDDKGRPMMNPGEQDGVKVMDAHSIAVARFK